MEINNIKKEKIRIFNRKVNLVVVLLSVIKFCVFKLRCNEDKMCYRVRRLLGIECNLFLGGIFFGYSFEIYFLCVVLKVMFYVVMDVFFNNSFN